MTQDEATPLSLSDVSVISADVHLGSEEAQPLMWEVNFADRDPEGYYIVSGWLHAAGHGVQATVSIGGILKESGAEYDRSSPRIAIEDDLDSLNGLYQRARTAARVIVGLTDADLEIPVLMPACSVEPFDSSTQGDDSEPHVEAVTD